MHSYRQREFEQRRCQLKEVGADGRTRPRASIDVCGGMIGWDRKLGRRRDFGCALGRAAVAPLAEREPKSQS